MNAEPHPQAPDQAPQRAAEPVVPDAARAVADGLAGERRVQAVVWCAGAANEVPQLIVVTSWDGRDDVTGLIGELGTTALTTPQGPPVAAAREGQWTGLSADGRRLDVEIVRLADFKPRANPPPTATLHDPYGHIAHWLRWCRGRKPNQVTPEMIAAEHTRRVLELDAALRSVGALPAPARRVRASGSGPLRQELADRICERASALGDSPVEQSLHARIDAQLADVLIPAGGLLLLGETGSHGAESHGAGSHGAESHEAGLERFLDTIAAERGELAARVLRLALQAAETVTGARTAFHSGLIEPGAARADAVVLVGDAVGGCRPPLHPALVIGVCWQQHQALLRTAPALVPATSSVAIRGDDWSGSAERPLGGWSREEPIAVEGPAAALVLGLVQDAHEDLRDLVTAGKRASEVSVPSVASELLEAGLATHQRLAAERLLGQETQPTRLRLALALAAAAEELSPLAARELGHAAARVLVGG